MDHQGVSNCSCHLVNRLCVLIVPFNLLALNLIEGVPTHIKRGLIRNAVENSIATQDYEVVKVMSNCELRYFRLSNQHALLSSVL